MVFMSDASRLLFWNMPISDGKQTPRGFSKTTNSLQFHPQIRLKLQRSSEREQGQEQVSRLISFRCLKGNRTCFGCLAVNNGMPLPIRSKSASVFGPMNGIYLHHKSNRKSSINLALQLQIYLPSETATPIARPGYI